MLRLPCYELDHLLLDLEELEKPIEESSHEIVTKLVALDTWVIEGSYLEWVEPLLRRADLIVWMDIPWRVASYRIIARHFKATIARNNRFPGLLRLYRFWRWSSRYYHDKNQPGFTLDGVPRTRSTAIGHLAKFDDKLVTASTGRQVERTLGLVR